MNCLVNINMNCVSECSNRYNILNIRITFQLFVRGVRQSELLTPYLVTQSCSYRDDQPRICHQSSYKVTIINNITKQIRDCNKSA